MVGDRQTLSAAGDPSGMTSTHPAPSSPFTVRPRRAGDPEPDLTGFVLIHRALRSGTRLVADTCIAIGEGAPCPSERHAATVWFAEHVLHEIHAHHEKEDDVLWPVIEQSARGQVDLKPLTDDHRALAGLLTRADELLRVFAADAGGAADLGSAMTDIGDELDEHIADEEAMVFPVMRRYVSATDFAHCEKLFQKGASFSHLVFILPWVMSQCSPAERAELLPKAPMPIRLLLRASEGRWQRRVTVVRG